MNNSSLLVSVVSLTKWKKKVKITSVYNVHVCSLIFSWWKPVIGILIFKSVRATKSVNLDNFLPYFVFVAEKISGYFYY